MKSLARVSFLVKLCFFSAVGATPNFWVVRYVIMIWYIWYIVKMLVKMFPQKGECIIMGLTFWGVYISFFALVIFKVLVKKYDIRFARVDVVSKEILQFLNWSKSFIHLQASCCQLSSNEFNDKVIVEVLFYEHRGPQWINFVGPRGNHIKKICLSVLFMRVTSSWFLTFICWMVLCIFSILDNKLM